MLCAFEWIGTPVRGMRGNLEYYPGEFGGGWYGWIGYVNLPAPEKRAQPEMAKRSNKDPRTRHCV
jgi:hypothetical protein